jgi:hypothetical protein
MIVACFIFTNQSIDIVLFVLFYFNQLNSVPGALLNVFLRYSISIILK